LETQGGTDTAGKRNMAILKETAQLVKDKLAGDYDTLTVERVGVGLFFTGVKLSGGACGLSYTPVKDIPQAVCCPSSAARIFDPFKINGMPAGDVLAALGSSEPIKTAIAIATLNAFSATCWERGLTDDYRIQMNTDALNAVRMPAESSVAVVGAFVPILRKLKGRPGKWWVIEQDPKTLKGDEMAHFIPADQSEAIIGDADVLIVTGVTLVNHTLEAVLTAARPDAEIAVIGPTASLLPQPLFERGVRVVGGVWVKKPDELLDVLAAGGSGYHFFDRLAPRIVIEKPS
jgi:uncharacterized protein (DUF4213/DUF364 family)